MASDNGGGLDMDGGVIDAAAAIAAIPGFDDGLSEPNPMQTRGTLQPQQPAPVHPADPNRAPNGQFRQQQAKQPAQVIDIKTKTEAAPAPDMMGAEEADSEASSPAEEYFELPPETEGGEPVRIKADEVFNGYQEAKQLKARIAELERGTPPPEVFDQQLMQLVDTQSQALQQLQIYQQLLAPREPDIELINEESPRYNPGLYQRQKAMSDHQRQQYHQVTQQIQAMEADRAQRVEALQNLQRVRGREALGKIWPEVVASDGKEAARVRSEVAEWYGQYGVTPEVMRSITNPGFYAVLKDALAYRRGLKDRETAVRVVREKPRLVKASARSGTNQRQQAYQAGMQRLTQSNSVEDAAQALAGLF